MTPTSSASTGWPISTYTVGWIAALDKELAAAKAVLDEIHQRPDDFIKHAKDSNNYVWGRIGAHNVVIASLSAGRYGSVSAASTAWSMMSSIPHLRFGLMVGIGAGVPRLEEDIDIRLGDVVVSQPSGTNPGVVQYDFGKEQGEFERVGSLNAPPDVVLKGISALKAKHMMEDSQIPQILEQMIQRYPKMAKTGFTYPGTESDQLFDASDQSLELTRPDRESHDPVIHYGLIASGDSVIKDGLSRDRIVRRLGDKVICFEMEAAGLANDFPCLLVRGISDYADSHKADRWQNYAAATAAAFTKELLCHLDHADVSKSSPIEEVLQEVKGSFMTIESAIRVTSGGIGHLIENNQSKRIDEWLDPADPSTNYNAARMQHHRGSGEWFTQSPQYTGWLRKPNSFLWLHGMPGCGKTILSSTIIADLQANNTCSKGLLYFFFDFRDPRKRSFEEVICSLTAQLYSRNERVRSHLDSLFAIHKTTKHRPDLECLCETFQAMLQDAGEVWIVLDALDECSERGYWHNRHIFSWIQSTFKEHPVHMLMTSRSEDEIRVAIENFAPKNTILLIRNASVDSDIQEYVKTRLAQASGFQRWQSQSKVLEDVEKSLTQKATGMFRWVSCQLDALEKCLDLRALQRELLSLPKDLDETYQRILEQISREQTSNYVQLLQFLVFSNRPLKLSEAVDVLAVDLDSTPRFETSHRLVNPLDVSRVCSSLITLVPNEHSAGIEKTTVQLAHFSVKEYFTSNRLPHSIARCFEETVARASIAKICLAYLTDLTENERRNPASFTVYSASEWYRHARKSENDDSQVTRLALEFLDEEIVREDNGTIYGNYERSETTFCATSNFLYKLLFDEERYSSRSNSYLFPPLEFASAHGLIGVVRALLDGDAKFDLCRATSRLPPTQLPLAFAAYGGHLNVAKLLIERGADLEATEELSSENILGTPLQVALDWRKTHMARYLLEQGASAEIAGSLRNASPLSLAAARNDVGMARTLISKGADANRTDDPIFGTPLIAALHPFDIYWDEEEKARIKLKMIRLLLEAGADPNASAKDLIHIRDKTASAAALSKLKHKQDVRAVIRLLVEYGLNINSALASISWTDSGVITVLVECAADVNASGGEYGSMLQHIALLGKPAPLDSLLRKGANVNISGGKFGTALQAASHSGFEGIVKTLLRAGADPNVQGGFWGNALQAAAATSFLKTSIERVSMVKALVEAGADANARGGPFNTALQAASWTVSCTHCGRALIEDKCKLESDIADFLRRIRRAEKDELNAQALRLLIRNGADVNAHTGIYGSPLSAAAYGGSSKEVRLLLRHGADLNADGEPFGVALQAAALGGWTDIIRLLLWKGADVDARGGPFGNALRAAIYLGHEECVLLLLSRGATLEPPKSRYDLPERELVTWCDSDSLKWMMATKFPNMTPLWEQSRRGEPDHETEAYDDQDSASDTEEKDSANKQPRTKRSGSAIENTTQKRPSLSK